jgi:hypothetical protein
MMRYNQTVVVVAFPGPEPVGQFIVPGAEVPGDWARINGNPEAPNEPRDLAEWVVKFLEKPEKFRGK